MSNFLVALVIVIDVPIVFYVIGWSLGAGWKRGRGELPSFMYINKADMELNSPQIKSSDDYKPKADKASRNG